MKKTIALLSLLVACVSPGPSPNPELVQTYSLSGPSLSLSSPSDALELEIAHSAERIRDIAIGWVQDPGVTERKLTEMRSMVGYLEDTSGRIEDELNFEPPSGPGELETQLDGKPLPGRAPYNASVSRSDRYGAVVRGLQRDFEGQQIQGFSSAGLIFYENAGASNFVACVSGGDGMKWDGGAMAGSLYVHDFHIHTLGLTPGAHADSFQGRGNLTSALFEDGFFDQPTNAGDGTRSNAAVIVDSSQGANGTLTFRRCIVRGGNYSIMTGDKGTGRNPGSLVFEDCAFIVENGSPRYGLLALGGGGTATFDEGCGVYSFNGSTCELLTRDVAGFDFLGWHQNEFGNLPAR